MDRPRQLLQPQACVEILTGPDAGTRFEFSGRTRVGSRRIADLVVRDTMVSGLHCELIVDERIRVRDLESKNGTHLRGIEVLEAVVPTGEILEIGTTQLRVQALDRALEIPLHEDDQFHGLVGHAPVMRALIAQIARLGPTDTTVLILGETGTGKECVAEALRRSGPRASGPLVILDCAGVPPTLIEAELFGYERGAFTGAAAARPGIFEQADGGTVFIDEIGELPLDLQPKLLRALEARQVRRLGGHKTIRFDVRILAATNRDLQLEVAQGRFREDLYWRLAVATLRIPSLRERIEDLPLLAVHLLKQMGIDPRPVLTLDTIEELSRHPWPGNVRELRNVLERAAAIGTVAVERPSATSDPIQVEPEGEIDVAEPFRVAKQRVVERFERAYISRLLQQCDGTVAEMAQRTRMERMSIYRLLQRLGLGRTRPR
jgi:DNA-binding NtrC family response regulator